MPAVRRFREISWMRPSTMDDSAYHGFARRLASQPARPRASAKQVLHLLKEYQNARALSRTLFHSGLACSLSRNAGRSTCALPTLPDHGLYSQYMFSPSRPATALVSVSFKSLTRALVEEGDDIHVRMRMQPGGTLGSLRIYWWVPIPSQKAAHTCMSVWKNREQTSD